MKEKKKDKNPEKNTPPFKGDRVTKKGRIVHLSRAPKWEATRDSRYTLKAKQGGVGIHS